MTPREFAPEPVMPFPAPLVVAPEIGAAIKRVMSNIKQLGYDDKNTSANYGFVSVDKFFAAIGPLMADAGLFLSLQELDTELFETQSFDRDGNPKPVKWLRNQYDVYLGHESGAILGPFHRTIVVLMTGPQAFGSAESYVQKRFLRMQFMIPTGDRDDADLHDQSAGNGQPRPQVTKPTGQTQPAQPSQPAQRAQAPRPAAQRQQPRPTPAAQQPAPQQESENPAPQEPVKFTSPQPVKGPGIEPPAEEPQPEQEEPTGDVMQEPEAPAEDKPKIQGPLPKNHPEYQRAIKEYNAINQKQAKAQTRKDLTQIVLENDARLAEMCDIAPEVKTAVEKLRAAIQNRLNTLK